MKKNSNKKTNGQIRVLGADAHGDSSRQLDADALKHVTGGLNFTKITYSTSP